MLEATDLSAKPINAQNAMGAECQADLHVDLIVQGLSGKTQDEFVPSAIARAPVGPCRADGGAAPMSQVAYTTLPDTLPKPVDDGACDHLAGLPLPAVALPSTQGGRVALDALPAGRSVIFCYPMTGQPGVALPDGWDEIPGARGCTPQNCAIRDLHADFAALGAGVYAVSTQAPAYQRELAERLHLPYSVLSDAGYELTNALRLPTFRAGDGPRLIRRLTMVVRDGTIEHVFYPVFPPDRSAEAVLDWLRHH